MNQPQKNSEKESLEREKSVDISNYRAFLNYLSLQLEKLTIVIILYRK